MGKINVGCETYTWQMAGEHYKGQLDHILAVTAKAGFKGLEPETSFIGNLSDPVLMKETLDKHGVELPVLCLVEDWLLPEETSAERAHADQWIDFLQHFPDTLLLLVQMPGQDRSNLKTRQENLLKCVNTIAERATDAGIICSYHPNSPSGSVYRTAADYEILLDGLDSKYIKYTPDIGHIARGGMDPLSVMQNYRELINCIHFKDMYTDGRWAALGAGDIDFDAICNEIRDSGFEGWIIVEDECDEAITDPDSVTINAGKYMTDHLIPILQS